MKSIITGAIVLLTIVHANAQWYKNKRVKGNGNVIEKTFNTSDYDGVKVSGSMDVELIKGDEGTITASAESNIMEFLEIEVKGDDLLISYKNGTNISTTKPVIVTVPVKRVTNISLSGSGDISANFTLNMPEMSLLISGSGDAELDLETKMLVARISGSGDIRVTGRTEDLEAKVTGSGDLDAYRLKANHVKARVTGSGDLEVYCNGGKLDAQVTGSGDITYDGNPSSVVTKVTGSGDISKR